MILIITAKREKMESVCDLARECDSHSDLYSGGLL